MDTQTQTKEDKEILEIFNTLPEVIKDAITKSGWDVTLRGIVYKYHLRIDQGTQLENMTFALMMGVMEPKEYFDNIHNDFGLDKDQADALFQDVDQKIFSQIESMINKSEPEAENNKQTFVKEESVSNDEVLTITRDEILKDIEDPKRINMGDNLPDLQNSVVMPTKDKINEIAKTNSLEIREDQIPSVTPVSNIVPIKKEELKVDAVKPLNPVDVSLNQTVSTNNKPAKVVDPYREPIE